MRTTAIGDRQRDEQRLGDDDERERPAVLGGRVRATVTAGGSGYTTRSTRSATARRIASSTSAGSYSATMTQNGNAWVMHLVAFKADRGSRRTRRRRPCRSRRRRTTRDGERHRQRDGRRDRRRRRGQRPVPGRRRRHRRRRTPTAPYALAWDTRTVPNGAHTLTRAGVRRGRATRSCPRRSTSTSRNTSSFQNEILATGFDLPTAIKFLPDGRMLVVGAAGHDQGAAAAVHDARTRRRSCSSRTSASAGVQQGIYDIVLDPELRDQPLLLRLLHARDRRTATGCRASRPTPCSPARSRAASSCSTRTRRTPTPSTTAAR